jgi:Mg-chelatase subunit ChlD
VIGGDMGTMQPDAEGMDAGDSGTMVQPDVTPVSDSNVAPDSPLDPDASCAMQTTDTTRAPMNLLIVLDRSGSMLDSGKWTAAVNGITRLLTLLTDDTRVGITIFPSVASPSVEASYAHPAVPIAPLRTSRAAIMMLLMTSSPTGDTPMACAMQGAVDYYNNFFTQDGPRSSVLITDGVPTSECASSSYGEASVQLAAGAAASLMPPVQTYVVGTPSASDSFLSQLAMAGGTSRMPGCATMNNCHYSLNDSSFETDLNHALDAIRGRAASCEFRIMVDTTTADPNLINVDYIPSPGAPSQVIPRDRSHMNGWDYSGDMHSVILYGGACDQFQANSMGGRIQILFGCPTITPS